MTILTKSNLAEKKGDKFVVPLVQDDEFANSAGAVLDPEDPHHARVIIGVRRVSSATIFCLFLLSLSVVGLGIYSGKCLYDQYIGRQVHHYRTHANIPYDDAARADFLMHPDDVSNELNDDNDASRAVFEQLMKQFLSEDIDVYTSAKENTEKIDVPDFRDGRSGRFIHDFNTNVTGIIDVTGRRCFVMPLNRENVLPPKSLIDLVTKMWDGYYKVDTQVVRNTMRVVTPPLDDLSKVGTYIAEECKNRPVYQLEKFVGGVVKRSPQLHEELKFAQFAGKKIVQFHIMNMDDVFAYEKSLQ